MNSIFDQSQDTKDGQDSSRTQSNTGAKRPRDETELAKGKLSDQSFDICTAQFWKKLYLPAFALYHSLNCPWTNALHATSAKYRDPLQGSSISHRLPNGITEDMERRWLETIAASRKQHG